MRRAYIAILISIIVISIPGCCCPVPVPDPFHLSPEPSDEPSISPSPAANIVINADWKLSSFYTNPPYPSVTSFDVLQVPKIPEPKARSSYMDEAFGTRVIRVTDRNAEAPDSGGGLKNEYSRVQSYNADGSLIMVRGIDGIWYLYDSGTLKLLKKLNVIGSIDPRWDASNPRIFYFVDGTNFLNYDVVTDEVETVHDFAQDFPGVKLSAVWTRYEGSPTKDGRYWGMMAENEDWVTIAFIIYDLKDDKVVAKRMLPRPIDADCVTISPLGNYFIAFFDPAERGTNGTDANPAGLMVYDSNLQNGRGLMRIMGHCDVGLDANGREIMVFQDIDMDTISMLDLGTGAITPLTPIDFSHTGLGLHFSGQAVDRPGWFIVSTYDGDPKSYTWMDDCVFAIETKPGGNIVRLAHTHSLIDDNMEHDYWGEPQASTSRDLTKILYTTNWGRSGTLGVDMYMIALPDDWTEKI